MEKCEKHNKKLVPYWKEVSVGHKRLVYVCPVCYNLKKYNFKCNKCRYKNTYYYLKEKPSISCPRCNGGSVTYYEKKIPTWRLNVEYADFKDIASRPLDEFGVPRMSESQWKAFYNQPHEIRRKKEIQQMKQKLLENI